MGPFKAAAVKLIVDEKYKPRGRLQILILAPNVWQFKAAAVKLIVEEKYKLHENRENGYNGLQRCAITFNFLISILPFISCCLFSYLQFKFIVRR
jgi:hypothetical protein